MKVHHLRPAEGAKRERTRKGRGISAGKGKTAGRGTKGWGARHTPKLGFEGGQMPYSRRVPKLKGFTNPNRVEYSVVNVGELGKIFGSGEVDPAALYEHGLVHKGRRVKVLAKGELDRRTHRARACVLAGSAGEDRGGRGKRRPNPVSG